MSLKSYWQSPGLTVASILSAAAVGLLVAPAPSLAEDVSGLTIVPKAPESVTINIAGKSRHQVFQEIRTAAYVVCRSAYLNNDLGAYAEAYSWCPYRTTDAAYSHYETILRDNPGIEVASIAVRAPSARD